MTLQGPHQVANASTTTILCSFRAEENSVLFAMLWTPILATVVEKLRVASVFVACLVLNSLVDVRRMDVKVLGTDIDCVWKKKANYVGWLPVNLLGVALVPNFSADMGLGHQNCVLKEEYYSVCWGFLLTITDAKFLVL